MGSVSFHEDDYCQVEVLPAANLAHILAEMGRIDEFAAAHSEPGGFTDMYVRGEAPQPLSSLGITLADLQSALDPLLTPFAEVYTGYSSYRERSPSAVAWGVPSGMTVFAHLGSGNVIGPVWLSSHSIPADQLALWCRVFRSLPRAGELVIADWCGSRVVPLADESAVVAYLSGEGE